MQQCLMGSKPRLRQRFLFDPDVQREERIGPGGQVMATAHWDLVGAQKLGVVETVYLKCKALFV